jgi:glucose-6-phosphate isomerase/transaldolase/glucose-6-phosphate isomerase
LGGAAEYPELIVLDSTVPAWVRTVTDAIDPAKTLFLVSSKSGSTIEPNTFYAHFRALVEDAVGKERAGQNFVAVTDQGTSLDRLAQDQGFRRVFRGPPDIGGRYSVLSYFGLVPAALSGVDIGTLLDRADNMREGCASSVASQDNPGAWLGAVMGTLAKQGRNKLTLITSPAIAGFGLWVEQLLAESTGKEGKGIVPIAGEPLTAPSYYGDDRLFVYLRLEGDDNSGTDPAVESLEASGQPVVRLELRDKYDLGAEFYRWEFATAIAGSVLGINPFDQPNVQSAKDMTDQVLEGYRRAGRLPPLAPESSIAELLAGAQAGDYLAIMAYIRQTPEVDQALLTLREKVIERYGIATTLGYGPRYLHSTGQLHKGGPAQGLFLQLTGEHQGDVSIPHQRYTFGVLADAQALGDLQALQATGRPVARVRLGTDHTRDILNLVQESA